MKLFGRNWAIMAVVTIISVVAACSSPAPTPTTTAPTATPTKPAATATTAAPTATSVPVPQPTAAPTPSGPQPKRGGTLVVAGSNNQGLDPHRNTFNSGERDVARLVFNGLLKTDPATSKPVADLATSWQYDSAGNLVFKLRPGVKFQNVAPVNGRLMTAEDVRFSLNRIMDPAKADPKASLRGNFASVKDIQVVDPQTVKLVLANPDAELLNFIAHEQTVIVPPEAAIDGSYGDPKSIIGTGPFIGKSVQPTGGQLRFERNPDYFVAGRPYLDGVNYLQNDNPEVRNSLLRTKQLDWAALQNPTDVTYFLSRGGVKISDTEGKFMGTTAIWFNTTIPPFNDIRLRRAINLGLDRNAITIAAFNGAASPVGPTGNSGAGGWDVRKVRTLPGFAIDKSAEIAQAKALMKDAGVPDGFTFQIHTDPSYYDPTMTVIQSQLKKDLKVTVEVVRDSSYNYRFASYMKDKSAQADYQQALGTSIDHALFLHYRSDGPRNMALLNNPDLDKLIDQERRTLDEAQRNKLLDEIQQKVLDI